MTILKDLRQTVELTLPITKGKVWIFDYMIAADSVAIERLYVSDTNISIDQEGKKNPINMRMAKYYEGVDKTLEVMIDKWDFTDEEKNPILPTPENLRRLPKEDFEFLYKEIEKHVAAKTISAEEKKT